MIGFIGATPFVMADEENGSWFAVYPHEFDDGERAFFTYDCEQDYSPDCDACVAGRCVQKVLTSPQWASGVLVHDCADELS